ncbi:hypothetical protein [Nonomuraea typhae]|uniref:hypothetical protein n=1 Tax=Nonomuraea typhae TaxID=2603600 RepID=UPI0012F8F0A4|nr:hypothetical protein [Nonomuraea typhae]
MTRLLFPVLAAMALLSACATAEPVVYSADYPAYESADKLYERASLVVEGTVTGAPARVQELRADKGGGSDPKLNPQAGLESAQQQPGSPVVISVYQVRVTKVFKGGAQPGQAVDVQQLGGTLRGVTYEESGAQVLRPGSGYVLFLETYPDAPAALLNPQQGQYPLDTAGNPVKLAQNPVTLTRDDLKRLSGHG